MDKLIELVADGLKFGKFQDSLKKAGIIGITQIHRFVLKTSQEEVELTKIKIVCGTGEVNNLFTTVNMLISRCGGICETYSIIPFEKKEKIQKPNFSLCLR